MSTTIDQKVVEMRFDNSQFEKNVATTTNSLEKLKNSLNMDGASKGLEQVENTARRFDMSPMSNAVETVRTKFSALEIMGVTALANITNSAVNAGKRIVSALTIDPISTGFNEYELKMGSIQTMMAATGEDLDTVNKYLNELNEYSDKTIYSFSDMTQNIGKFTNAGVSLKDSVAAIQGISNVAAVSGANANEASRAMYNFAQALSSGYVKLIDWKSIELANMGTVEFKQQLIDAAVAAGTLKKSGDGMYKTLKGKTISATKGFNDSLADQWMTSEVLIDTLQKYSDETTEIGKKATEAATEIKTLSMLYDTLKESAQSGWAATWEIIVGDFEEAKEFMTELSNIIGKWIGDSADARNDLLENWKILGGRTALLESIKNLLTAIATAVKPLKDAFNEVFPPLTAERLVGFCEGLRNLTKRLIMSDETADKVKRTFKGFFAVIDIVRQVFVGVINVIGDLLDPVGSLGGGILSITATIGDLLVGLNNFIKRSNIISGSFQAIGKVVGWVVEKIGELISFIADGFSDGPARAILDFLDTLEFDVSGAFDGMGEAIKNSSFYKVLMQLLEFIKKLSKTIFGVLGDALHSVFNGLNVGSFADLVDTLVGGGLGVAIGKFIWDLSNRISSVTDFVGAIGGILDEVAGAFEAFQNALNATAIMTLAKAILTLAIALIALSLVNKDKLADGLSVVTLLMTELVVAMHVMGKAGKVQTFALLNIARTLLLLTIPLVILGKMKWDTIKQGLIAMGGVLLIVTSTIMMLSKIKYKGALKHIGLLYSIAFALVLLSIPLAILGNMEWITIGRGLTGMFSVLALMVTTLAILQKIKTNGVLRHIGLLSGIAASLVIMVVPMLLLGAMSWEALQKGVIGISILLTEMLVVLAILQRIKTNGVLKKVTLLHQIGLALLLLAAPMHLLGIMSWDAWTRGIVGITILLGELIGALALMQTIKTNGVLKNITTLLAICGALGMLATSVLILGSMNWESMAQGIIGVGVLMGGLLIVMEAMARISAMYGPATMLNATSSIILMAAAVMMLIVPLKTLAKLDTDKMWQAIGGLAVIMGGLTIILAGLAAISNTYSGGIVKGASSIMIMAAAVMLLVPPLLLLSLIPVLSLVKALAALAATFIVLGVAGYLLQGVAPVILALSASLFAMGMGMLAAGAGTVLFGTGLTLVAAGITAVAGSLAILLRALASASSSLQVVIAALVAGVITGLGQGFVALLNVIADAIPAIGEIIKQLILTICDILVSCIPVLVDTVIKILASLLDSLVSFAPKIITSLFELILIILDGLVQYIGPIIDRVFQFVIAVLDAIAANLEPVLTALNNLFVSLLEAVFSSLSAIDTSGLVDALLNVGIINAIVLGLAAVALVSPLALIGVFELAKIVGVLTIVLAALGALAQIPGLEWLIAEGGHFLQTIGTAIGQFIGGIMGGIGQGITSSFPEMADNLSEFMTRITPFIEGAKTIDETSLTGIQNLVKMVLLITAASILDGLTAWITGGNSIGKFASDLIVLGVGLKGFSDSVAGIDTTAIASGVDALKLLAEMTQAIPNSGGIFSWFTGNDDNQISTWASQLPILGVGLLGFSNACTGINSETISAGTEALKKLAEMTQAIPNAGGLFSWFTGNDNGQITDWALQLPILGVGLLGFSKATEGIVAENITAAANAAKSLAEMTQVIPNSGGVVAWFTGENSIVNFAGDLAVLGRGLKSFATETEGITPESVKAAATAAKDLAEMTSYIPSEGGIKAWFAGETSVSKFANELPTLATGLSGFSKNLDGFNPENASKAATAAKDIAEMTKSIPSEGGIKAWFTGESAVSKFAGELPKLGSAMSGFSESVSGINPENVQAAASAAKSLAEMTKTVPKDTDKIVSFGENLESFGTHLSTYFTNTAGVSADAAGTMGKIVDACNKFASINSDALDKGASAIKKLVEAIKKTSGVSADTSSGFVASLKKLGEVSADAIVKSFDKLNEKMKKVGKEAVKALAAGLSENASTATKAAKQLVTDCADAISEKAGSFKTSGKNLVQGFADGISENTYIATAKAKAMAKAAAESAKEALDINSPSKVFREIGSSVPEGFAIGVGKYGNVITASVEDMSDVAIDGVKDSLKRVADIINDDSYTNPTIRPVLDLSDIKYGVGQLNSMLGGSAAVAMTANVGAINARMSNRSQNGNFNDVVKSVDKLGDKLDNVGNTTYIIDGVTYDDGSAVAGAVETLIHATKVDRRT